jgi:hypothetical protein
MKFNGMDKLLPELLPEILKGVINQGYGKEDASKM